MTNDSRWGDLPPPPPVAAFAHDAPTDREAPLRLELELFVNSRATGHIASVTLTRDRFQLLSRDLAAVGLRIDASDTVVELAALAGVRADYDAPRQRLYLTVSPDQLPNQRIGAKPRQATPASYDVGALLNYDTYVSGGGTKLQASIYHEARVFSRAGTLSTSGALRTGPGKSYIRYDSYFRRSDETTSTTIEAGDFITRSLPWAPAVRLGGIQVSRDFSVRPDIVTYPLPDFRGSAALPSTVELVVGGQRIAGGAVEPGPFAIETLPPINGFGEANLIVTDMNGRAVEQSLPFYVSSALLRPGITDFAVAFGAFRQHYGTRNFDYGGVAATASARRGITDSLTLEVRAEIADDMSLAGGGAVVRLGHFGTISGSYSRSFRNRIAGGDGSQLALGYDYQTSIFSIGLRHTRRSAAYVDLGLLDRSNSGWERVTAATISLSLGTAGTLGLGYFDIQREVRTDTRLVNASWSLPLWRGSRLQASASRIFDDDDWSGAFTLSVPLGGRNGTLSGGLIGQSGDDMVGRADYVRPVPVAGGLGWSASAFGNGSGLDWRGDVTWRTDPVQLRAGAYGAGDVTGWFGASGSLVFIDNAFFAANRVADAFVVVNTGTADIPVRYENQLVGHTDKDGRLLIPSASAWYAAKYEIDPLGLPADVKVGAVEQRVAVAAGGGHVVRFDVELLRPARAVLRDANGTFVPAGALAAIDGAADTIVGWDGALFIDSIGAANTTRSVRITLADGHACSALFTVPSAPPADTAPPSRAAPSVRPAPSGITPGSEQAPIVDLGELICRN